MCLLHLGLETIIIDETEAYLQVLSYKNGIERKNYRFPKSVYRPRYKLQWIIKSNSVKGNVLSFKTAHKNQAIITSWTPGCTGMPPETKAQSKLWTSPRGTAPKKTKLSYRKERAWPSRWDLHRPHGEGSQDYTMPNYWVDSMPNTRKNALAPRQRISSRLRRRHCQIVRTRLRTTDPSNVCPKFRHLRLL